MMLLYDDGVEDVIDVIFVVVVVVIARGSY